MWPRLLRVAFLGWLLAVPSFGVAGGNVGGPGTPEAFRSGLGQSRIPISGKPAFRFEVCRTADSVGPDFLSRPIHFDITDDED